MNKKIAILQCSAEPDTATEALDMALSLASFDQPVQLILSGDAFSCLLDNPSKRYGMLELLDAEPIGISSHSSVDKNALPSSVETSVLPPENLKEHLNQFDEVLQFS
ncbi:DsrE family protein [Idiomarina aminovorans]|uniref:DsrE family protein n=1 Tax=Idiomarina aminovorans TaxID=2914829 RepID=UPI002003FD0F|nr:DsrE family protein [Idiomarina sp. ATCH4]MCK7458646.1 DsrE family protein [Idiomarina sp. ATCH4]